MKKWISLRAPWHTYLCLETVNGTSKNAVGGG